MVEGENKGFLLDLTLLSLEDRTLSPFLPRLIWKVMAPLKVRSCMEGLLGGLNTLDRVQMRNSHIALSPFGCPMRMRDAESIYNVLIHH